MLRYFDNTEGKVKYVFFKLEPVPTADADGLFQVLDRNLSGPLSYDHLVGLGAQYDFRGHQEMRCMLIMIFIISNYIHFLQTWQWCIVWVPLIFS